MSFWKNKRVLVTGGSGFIGSHLVERLLEVGALVTVPVRDEVSHLGFLKAVRDDVQICIADLMEIDACIKAIEGHEIVMNLAARVGGVDFNIKHPGSIFRNNLQLFMNVLEASRKCGVERFLVTSSACVYPRFCTIPTPEEEGMLDRPEPTNEGYGWAKRMEEFLGDAYAREFGMKIAIARPYNAYGPRDNFSPDSSHVIPALIKRIFDGENPLVVWSDGTPSRSFLFVSDFVRGLMEVAEKHAESDPLNLGADEEISIRDLSELLIELSGKDIRLEFDASKPGGQPRRKCDIRKAYEKIRFCPQVPLREGLRRTIDWYKSECAG